MFDFLFAAPHEDRVIDNYDKDGVVVDTSSVNDGEHPYETGVCHPKYNEGKWIIVEAYDTKEMSQVGHDKWVGIMTSPDLPDCLVDCNNSGISNILVAVAGDDELKFYRKVPVEPTYADEIK